MKFCGHVGFVMSVEKDEGDFRQEAIEQLYYGDVMSNYRRVTSGDKLNDDVTLNNKISILANKFALDNMSFMRYVRWLGQAWSINSVELAYPRIILEIGGLYNGRLFDSQG